MEENWITVLKNAGVDTEGTIQRFMGNAGLYRTILTKFLEDGTYAEIAPAFAAGDGEKSLTSVHTLKGVAGNLGFTRLYEACSETVRLLRAGEKEKAKASLPEVQDAYEEITAVIRGLDR